ncbi:J domain-containing protein [Agromyces marinus]|uniref:J domain-containing protein n=1 Tax=Agromyces marinus TaxID=1389020 RepID=A0ABN6YCI9_9MICO|nr:J domain-containing protein [Agromyces marinus]UIP58126.1 Chaperone protein DnaJ [Agromyces marinus]BDZ53645.1 hypothetical protein GCM10025870_07180 [Agromyces marinus]
MAEPDLSREDAARLLGIDRDADAAEVDRAYRRLARDLHPDRLSGASADEVRAANARFSEVTRAYHVLASAPAPGAGRRADTDADTDADGPTVRPAGRRRPRPAPRFSPALFATWTGLLLLGAALSASTGPLLWPFDLWGRLALLVAAAVTTALTRRRWAWWTTLALLAASGVAVIAATTIAGLLGLGAMAIGCVGLAVQAGLVRFPDQD